LARIRSGTATPEEQRRFQDLRRQRSEWVLDAPIEDLYLAQEVEAQAPRPARVLASVACASCGEPTMETRIRRLGGRNLCLPCFDAQGGP